MNHRDEAPGARRRAQALGDDEVTPPGGYAAAPIDPAEAVVRIAEELAEVREFLHRLDIATTRAATLADRGEKLSDRANATAEGVRQALLKVEEALLPMMSLPSQLHATTGHLVQLQHAVAAMAGRLSRLEQEVTQAKTLAGRSWRATNELRGEIARQSDFILESMRRLEREASERARLERELGEVKAQAARAVEEAEEAQEWAVKTGQHRVDELALRATKGDELKDLVVKQALDERRIWTRTKAKVVLSIFSAAVLTALIAALAQRC